MQIEHFQGRQGAIEPEVLQFSVFTEVQVAEGRKVCAGFPCHQVVVKQIQYLQIVQILHTSQSVRSQLIAVQVERYNTPLTIQRECITVFVPGARHRVRSRLQLYSKVSFEVADPVFAFHICSCSNAVLSGRRLAAPLRRLRPSAALPSGFGFAQRKTGRGR